MENTPKQVDGALYVQLLHAHPWFPGIVLVYVSGLGNTLITFPFTFKTLLVWTTNSRVFLLVMHLETQMFWNPQR